MRSAAACREHAKECRALAISFDGERRQQTLEMAKTWENLAREVDSTTCRHMFSAVRATYDGLAREQVPQRFLELLRHLKAAESDR